MRCIKCRKPANVEVRRHRSAFCAGCYPGWFRDQVERVISHDKMFTREQKVLVAVSGGKDSLALWHALLRCGGGTKRGRKERISGPIRPFLARLTHDRGNTTDNIESGRRAAATV